MTTNAHPAEEVDFVVVGSGTGLLGAIAAAEFGLRVLVVEGSEYLGGSTAMSGGGFWIPDNPILHELGVHDSRERASAYVDAVVGDTAPRERRQAHLEHGPAAVDVLRRNLPNRWLHMREYADYFPELDGGSAFGRALESAPFDLSQLGPDRAKLRPTPVEAPVPMPVTGRDYRWMALMARKPRGLAIAAVRFAQGAGGMLLKRQYASAGQALAAGLIIAARKRGVALWTESPLRDLLLENGRVAGVVVEREGREVTVRAERGVLLAGGGFEHNLEMRHQYQSKALEEGWSLANPANKGEVIRIAQARGAALTLMDQAWWFPAVPPAKKGGYPSTLLAERSLPGSIIVGPDGRRFMNESVNYMTAGQIMLGLDDSEAPHLPAWIVFDQTYRNRYVFANSVMPRAPLPEEWYEQGLAHRGDSLEELAQKLGLPAARDRAAVQRDGRQGPRRRLPPRRQRLRPLLRRPEGDAQPEPGGAAQAALLRGARGARRPRHLRRDHGRRVRARGGRERRGDRGALRLGQLRRQRVRQVLPRPGRDDRPGHLLRLHRSGARRRPPRPRRSRGHPRLIHHP